MKKAFLTISALVLAFLLVLGEIAFPVAGNFSVIKAETKSIVAAQEEKTEDLLSEESGESLDGAVATDFTLDTYDVSLYTLEMKYFTVNWLPGGSTPGEIKLTSSNPKVVKVGTPNPSAAPFIVAQNGGTATITATLGSVKRQVKVTITQKDLTGFRVDEVAYDSVKFMWGSWGGPTSTELYRSKKKTSGFTCIQDGVFPGHVDGGLKPGATYYYKIRTYRLLNGVKYYSKYSPVIKARPVPAQPIATATSAYIDNAFIMATSGPIDGATGYQYIYKVSPNGKWKSVKSPDYAYLFKHMAGDKTYLVRMRGYRKVGKKTIYGVYSDTCIKYVNTSIPNGLAVNDMKIGYGTKFITSPLSPGWYTNKINWFEYQITNNGQVSATISGPFWFEGAPSKKFTLANIKGTRKSSITIKPGKTVTVRFKAVSGFYWQNITAAESFSFKLKYDGLYYLGTLQFHGYSYVNY